MNRSQKVLGKKMRMVRIIRGFSQTVVSKRIGVGRSSLANWEIGCYNIPNDILCKLAELYELKDAETFHCVDIDSLLKPYEK